MIISGQQNLVKFTHLISKCYVKCIFSKVKKLYKATKELFSSSFADLLIKERSKGT